MRIPPTLPSPKAVSSRPSARFRPGPRGQVFVRGVIVSGRRDLQFGPFSRQFGTYSQQFSPSSQQFGPCRQQSGPTTPNACDGCRSGRA
jgi:hypothetical protein